MFGLELIPLLRYFREKRLAENLSQAELLKQELKLIAWAILTIVLLLGFLIALAIIIGRLH